MPDGSICLFVSGDRPDLEPADVERAEAAYHEAMSRHGHESAEALAAHRTWRHLRRRLGRA